MARGPRIHRTAVDFAKVALDRGRQQAEAAHVPSERITWIEADLIDYRPAPFAFDVVIIAYLQMPEQPRRIVTARAVEAVAPGGVLLVIGHDLANLTYGTGGPQQPEVLFRPQDVVADIRATDRPLRIVRADTVRRPVDGSDRDAIDALVRAETVSSAAPGGNFAAIRPRIVGCRVDRHDQRHERASAGRDQRR